MPESDNSQEPVKENFRVLLTGFGPYGQWDVNPSWLAVKPLHNVTLQTDPASHPRQPPADDKPLPPLDEKLLIPRPIYISTLEVPMTYQAVLDIVPGLHLRPPVLPENVEEDFQPPTETGYDFILHVGLAGRGSLRLERVGHKLGYNMKDSSNQYAPVVIPQPKDFSRRAPDAPPMTISEKAELERFGLSFAPEVASAASDSNTKPNRGLGGPAYDNFSDELNTDLDVTRIVQDLRQTGVEALQSIYSSMDGGHFLGDFLYYCSLAESKRSANPYEKRTNTRVLFLHIAPPGFSLDTEEVTNAIKRIVQWVCNELQICINDDTPDLPPVSGVSNKSMPIRYNPPPPVSSKTSPPPANPKPFPPPVNPKAFPPPVAQKPLLPPTNSKAVPSSVNPSTQKSTSTSSSVAGNQ